MGTVLAGIGVLLALLLVWIHLQIDKGGEGYTSFCNVNSRINCDYVLASPFARVVGIPVAWLALFAYATLAALYQGGLRASAPSARNSLLLACAGSVGAAGFSAYMAFVSFYVLGTICLMCTGLYVVSLGLVAIALMLPSRYAQAYAGTDAPPFSSSVLAGISALALVGAAGFAGASWPGSSEVPSRVTIDDVLKDDPEFYSWYLRLPVVELPDTGGHVVGSPTAPVTIVEFSDFECAYCSRNHAKLEQLLEQRPDLVRVVYRHFPLDTTCNDGLETSVHSRACRAAEAAECAAQQGRFREMADALFTNQNKLFDAYLFTLAEHVGVDMDTFRSCMSEHGGRSAILADTRAGNRLNITSTPTLFINGRKVVGTLADLKRYVYAVVIESQLSKTHGKKEIEG